MHTYRIEHDGPNERRAVKRILESSLDYKLPAYITFAAADGEHEYYAEDSNVNRGVVIVLDRKCIW